MSTDNRVTELYEKLFSVGSLSRNITLYSLAYVIYLLLISLITRDIIPYALIPAYSLIFSKIYLEYLSTKRDSRFFCLRRLFALHTVENLSILILLVIEYILVVFFQETIRVLIPILIGIIVIEGIVFIPTLYSGLKNGNLLIISKVTVILILLNVIGISIILPIVGSISGLLVTNIAVYLIDMKSKKYAREGIFEYLRGYIDSWLLDNPEKLDSLIHKNSPNLKIPVDQIIFPDTLRRTAHLLIPYFHFGPFKNVGSSRFPSIAGESFYTKNGFLTGVFHGPSTHDRDLASNSEVYSVLDKCMEYKGPVIFHEISNIEKIENGKAAVKYIRLGDSIMLFLEYEEMEDIPYEIVDTLKSAGKKMGYPNVIIVDTHNSLVNKRYVLKDDDVSLILKTGIEALEEGKTSVLQKFRVGVEKVELPNISLKDGLGRNGIYILVLDTLIKKNIIVIIDSNNLHPKLKKELEEKLIESGFDNVVIATTDTHEVTALELVEGGYRILGENEELNKIITDTVTRISKKILENLRDGDGHIYSSNINAHVIGFNLLEKLSKMTLESYKYMKKIFTYMLIPLTLIITILLLMV